MRGGPSREEGRGLGCIICHLCPVHVNISEKDCTSWKQHILLARKRLINLEFLFPPQEEERDIEMGSSGH